MNSKFSSNFNINRLNFTLLNFELINYSSNQFIDKLKEFWNLIFTLYDIVSIQLENHRCFILIAVQLTDEKNINNLISQIKTQAVKNLPNEFELQIKSFDFILSNTTSKTIMNKEVIFEEIYTVFELKDIVINNNIYQTLEALMDFPFLRMTILSYHIGKNKYFCLSFHIKADNEDVLKKNEKTLIDFLKLNPNINGSLLKMKLKKISKNLLKFLIGYNNSKLKRKDIIPIVNSISTLIKKERTISNMEIPTIYPWLGFEKNNSFKLKTKSTEIIKFKESNIADDTTSELILKEIKDIFNLVMCGKIEIHQSKIVISYMNIEIIFHIYHELPESIDEFELINISSNFDRFEFVIHNDSFIPDVWNNMNIDIIHINYLKEYMICNRLA